MCHMITYPKIRCNPTYSHLNQLSAMTKVTNNLYIELKIAMKLASFFLFLKTHNIVNLNIKPDNIQVFFITDNK